MGPDEVVLGPKLADALGVGVGDDVELALADGGVRALEVVGLGIGSTMGQEGFGNGALVTPDALEGAAVTGMFDELLVRAAPGADVDGLVADLAVEHELSTPAPPATVQDVLDLDRIPDLLAAYLAFVALAALANGLAVVVRRRSRDLAILRAIGLTPRQIVGAVLSAALATAAIGLVVGVPVGLGLGRLIWWLVADRVGLATDVLVPVAEIVLVVRRGPRRRRGRVGRARVAGGPPASRGAPARRVTGPPPPAGRRSVRRPALRRGRPTAVGAPTR